MSMRYIVIENEGIKLPLVFPVEFSASMMLKAIQAVRIVQGHDWVRSFREAICIAEGILNEQWQCVEGASELAESREMDDTLLIRSFMDKRDSLKFITYSDDHKIDLMGDIDGATQFYIFPNSFDHNNVDEIIMRMKYVTADGQEFRNRNNLMLRSAGFIDPNGQCYGHSYTLNRGAFECDGESLHVLLKDAA